MDRSITARGGDLLHRDRRGTSTYPPEALPGAVGDNMIMGPASAEDGGVGVVSRYAVIMSS